MEDSEELNFILEQENLALDAEIQRLERKKKRSEDPEAETEVPGGVSEPFGRATSGNDTEMEFGDEPMGTSSASTDKRAREESAQSAGQRAAVKKKPAPSGSPGKRPTGERPMAEEPGPVRPRKLEELVHDSETAALDYVDQEHAEAVNNDLFGRMLQEVAEDDEVDEFPPIHIDTDCEMSESILQGLPKEDVLEAMRKEQFQILASA